MNNIIDIVFSIGTFLVFGTVLAIYNWKILVVFLIGNGLYILWVLAFMKFRREIDYKSFAQSAKLQNNMVQFIQGMPEIKLNGIERAKLWEWEHLQAGLYRISVRGLKIGQIQSSGSMLISTITNLFISYLSARMVVTGELSLGMMMSLSFIIGQVAGPIGSFVGFACSYQDAKISLERLNDINTQEDETLNDELKESDIPLSGDIVLDNVSFSYSGDKRRLALSNVTLTIPHDKVTAVVGASGSGKTTLIKMLQGFYVPLDGCISIGNMPLQIIKSNAWRKHIGSVMQDGYIFSDTIAHNIAVASADGIDKMKMYDAAQKANLSDFVQSLPLNYGTKIGNEGVGLSQGQKQRILLARVLYKSPEIILLDEATNALDANNEREIMNNLKEFYRGKTVVIVAHRLSTVKDADNIVVLDKGVVVEQGTHEQLVTARGYYYELVKNQLDLNE